MSTLSSATNVMGHVWRCLLREGTSVFTVITPSTLDTGGAANRLCPLLCEKEEQGGEAGLTELPTRHWFGSSQQPSWQHQDKGYMHT